MEVLLGIIIFIGYVLLVLLMRSLTTLFHELGHAIPSLLFTRKRVQVFVGTYGNVSKGIKMGIGRLEVFFKLNLFSWNMGMCQHQGVAGFWKNIIIILGGPFASLIICIPLIWIMIANDLSNVWVGIIMIFVAAAGMDFMANISPFGRKIRLDDGSLIMSDGQKLAYMMARLKLPDSYFELERFFEQKNYRRVIEEGDRLIEQSKVPLKATYNLLIEAYKKEGRNTDALSLYEKLNDIHDLTYADFHDVGKINARLNKPEEAMKFYNHCIHQNHSDAEVLYDRSQIYKDLGDYQKAKMDLDAAIYHHSAYIKAYTERGFVHIKLKNLDAAYKDLTLAKESGADLPYIYYYLGLYHEEKKDLNQALKYYEKAKEMNIDYHGIDYKIHMVSSN